MYKENTPMMPLLDPNHPFFRPRWRRWLVALSPLLWSCVEFWNGNMIWGILFVTLGAYAFWQLIMNGPSSS